MYMNMTIIIYMNIYISKENEERLRQEASMSGLINHLLEEYYAGQPVTPVAPEPVYEAPSPRPETKFSTIAEEPKLKVLTNDDLKALLGASGKQPIISEPTHVCKDNCKHWVWDTDKGGRVNTLTGEFQEGSPW